MKRIFFTLCLSVIILSVAIMPVIAADFPSYQGYVNDFSGVLSSDTTSKVEDQLTLLEADTSAEVAVLIIDSLEDLTLEEYAVGIFEDWRIGKKGDNNGVLLLIALQERQVRIEVGYGLEPIITDGRAGRILDNDVIPYLKDDDYDNAVESGISAIEYYIRDGDIPAPIEDNPVQNAISGFDLPLPLLVGLGFFSIYILGFMARTKSIWLGGIWGFIVGIILGFGFGSILAIVILAITLAITGTFLDLILSQNYNSRSASGLSTGWISSRGGFKGGSGGGFGGFGGGFSGGGGASRGF